MKSIFIVILLSISVYCSNNWKSIIFPIYDFSLHNTPVIFNNKTYISNELNFYNNIRKVSFFHVFFSAGMSLVGLVHLLPTIITPFTLSYWGYTIYMNYKSAHIEQQCAFLLDEINMDKKYSQLILGNRLKIPNFIFHPLTFYVILHAYMLFICKKKNKLDIKKLLFILIGLFYMFSFLQEIKHTVDSINIKKMQKLNELKWKCHVNRMTFWRSLMKQITSLWGKQSDKNGYLVGDKECDRIESELMNLMHNKESIIVILIKTLLKPLTTVIIELNRSISTFSKILIFIIFFLCVKY